MKSPLKQHLAIICIALLSSSVSAQKIEIGAGASFNYNFLSKGHSEYDPRFFKTSPTLGMGLSIPVNYHYSKKVDLRTGLGFKYRTYSIYQDNFDIPNFNARLTNSVNFVSWEIPLLISYQANFIKNTKIQYLGGVVMALNSPQMISSSSEAFGGDTGFVSVSQFSTDNLKNSLACDLYAGISFVRYRNAVKHSQITLAFQYGYMPLGINKITNQASNSQTNKTFNALLKPSMSSVIVEFVRYPRWLNRHLK